MCDRKEYWEATHCVLLVRMSHSHFEKAISIILSSAAHEKHSRRRQIGRRAMTHPFDISQQSELHAAGNTALWRNGKETRE